MVYDVGLKFQCEEIFRPQIFTKENLRSTSRLLPKPATYKVFVHTERFGFPGERQFKMVPSSISFLKPTECLDFCYAVVSTSLTCMLAAFCTCQELVRSHLSFGCEIWAPQGPSADLLHLERIRRRATKFSLKDYELSDVGRLKKLNLISLSYWHEIKDIPLQM
jgi:hypothetical protein